MKKCPKCLKKKALKLFSFRSGNRSKEKRSYCKSCEVKSGQKYQLNNRDKYLNYKRQFKKKNREVFNFYERKRKYLKRSNYPGVTHTIHEWEDLKQRHENTCLRCKKSEPEIRLTADHIVPLSKGGSDCIGNIQPLCIKCNQIKNNREERYGSFV